MKKKIIVIILSIVLSSILIIGIIIFNNLDYIVPWNIKETWVNKTKTKEEILLYDFINDKLTEEGYGIYTNYLPETTKGDITKGHDVLSESEGLIMLYAVEEGDKELFNKHYEIVKNSMMNEDGLIAWRRDKKEKSKTSATIDEFRIALALAYGYDRWGDFKYRKDSVDISNSVYKNVIVGNRIMDFKDEYGVSKNTTICYLNLTAIKLFGKLNNKWNEIYVDSRKLIRKAKISKDLPLYRTIYNNDEKVFDGRKEADTLLSLIVTLNIVEANEGAEDTIKWMKKQIDDTGVLCSYYDVNTGMATNKVESTAIYSIAAMIFDKTNDKTYYNKMIKKLQTFQIKDKSSEIYGSFGNAETKQVYSFDNLNALLALQRR